MYEKRIQHAGLKAFRIIRHSDLDVVNMKAQLQAEAWNARWQRVLAQEAKRLQQERASLNVAANKQVAAEKTAEARKAIEELEKTLLHGIELDSRVDWESLKNKVDYPVPKPRPPMKASIPSPPLPASFTPKLSWLQVIIPALRKKPLSAAHEKLLEAERNWHCVAAAIDRENSQASDVHRQATNQWEAAKATFRKEQLAQHADIEQRRERYLAKDLTALNEYWEAVLSQSEYPDSFPKSFMLEYLGDSRTLIVEYALPSIECLPQVKEVKYIQARNAFQEVPVSATWLNKTYDEVLYQIALRTLHELFQSDEAQAADSIVFNGWVSSIDKATGQDVNACILSIQVNKPEFMSINLAQVEPKACFKKFKGISATKLTELTPVKPILQLNKEDHRFIAPYEVVDSLDGSSNLAAMDWQDFENLIRGIFEQEFSANGGEVKITQASRDGSVDAVAFDPDPIRGGKIVIQAKRYTNTVSVSAVRDLYGTVMNEGAMKGILVTTADYGRDAFEFAKDKPLTLISGSELLYLLQKHGHKVKIDLAEARRMAAAN